MKGEAPNSWLTVQALSQNNHNSAIPTHRLCQRRVLFFKTKKVCGRFTEILGRLTHVSSPSLFVCLSVTTSPPPLPFFLIMHLCILIFSTHLGFFPISQLSQEGCGGNGCPGWDLELCGRESGYTLTPQCSNWRSAKLDAPVWNLKQWQPILPL